MTRQEKYNIVTGEPYGHTFAPNTTVITRKNGLSALYCYIDTGGYTNDAEMRNTQKFMAIPNNNSVAHREEFEKTQKKNPVHGVLVDIDDIQHIKLVDGNRNTISEHSF